MSNLSNVDRTILRMIQTDSKTRLEDIASEAGASVATIQRRLKHLRATGTIRAETALIEPGDVGLGMSFLILVELEREALHQLDNFKRKIRNEPHVQQCYYITGDADFALFVLAEDMDDYQKLIQRLFFDDANVKRFRTSVVMERTKTGLAVPV